MLFFPVHVDPICSSFCFRIIIRFMLNIFAQEKLESIERDQCEYTLDEEDRAAQDAILSREPSKNDVMVLKKSLSCSYPNMPLDKALRKESEKLQLELQRSQAHMDAGQYEVIQHLIGVTKTVANSLPDKDSQPKNTKKFEEQCSDYERTEENAGKKYIYPSLFSDFQTRF